MPMQYEVDSKMTTKNIITRIKELEKLKPYIASPYIDSATTILDANENLVIPKNISQGALSIAKRTTDSRIYPKHGTLLLRDALAKLVGVSSKNMIVGNGSDQILDLLLAHIMKRGSTVLVTDPTFSFFEARCELHGIKILKVPFSENMTIDMGKLESLSSKADMIYLDSPNNPTGFQFPERSLRKLIKSFDGLVVVDEAYAEFGKYTLVSMPKSQENLIVVRTLSKSFGLAGLRVGYAVATRVIANIFNNIIQYPYPISTVSTDAAIAAMEQSRINTVQDSIKIIKTERKRIIDSLGAYATITAFSSEANFVLFDAGSAYTGIYTALSEQGILVRKMGTVGTRKGCIRVTIGTHEMNSRFLTAIRDLMG